MRGGILLSAPFSVFKSLPDQPRWCWKNSSPASWLSLTASQWKHDAIPTLSASKISDSGSNRVDIYKLMSRISHAKWRPWPHNCCHLRQAPLDRSKSLDVNAKFVIRCSKNSCNYLPKRNGWNKQINPTGWFFTQFQFNDFICPVCIIYAAGVRQNGL